MIYFLLSCWYCCQALHVWRRGKHAACQCCLFSIVLPSDVSVSDWLMSSHCPLSSTLSFLTSPQCVCGLIMYFCLLTHDPHNLFRDPSFVWLKTSNSYYHVHRYSQANITLICCNSSSLCVARCCVAMCDDTCNDDVADSSSHVLSCACCLCDLCGLHGWISSLFLCFDVCVPLCSVPKKITSMSLVWIVIRVNSPTATANAGVSHVDPLFACHWLILLWCWCCWLLLTNVPF